MRCGLRFGVRFFPLLDFVGSHARGVVEGFMARWWVRVRVALRGSGAAVGASGECGGGGVWWEGHQRAGRGGWGVQRAAGGAGGAGL